MAVNKCLIHSLSVLFEVGSRAFFLLSYENFASVNTFKKAALSSTGYSFQGGLFLAVFLCMVVMYAEIAWIS